MPTVTTDEGAIDEAIHRVEKKQTTSESVVAVEAAEALRELTSREYQMIEEFLVTLKQNSNALIRANRSHAPLFTTQRRIVTEVTDAEVDTVEDVKDRLLDAIDAVVTKVETSKTRAGEKAASLIDDGDVLLLHGNSSTVMGTVEQAAHDGKHLEVYVTESRPCFSGRLVARRLAEWDSVEPTLITDAAAGHRLSACDRVMFGMNCVIDAFVHNRVGSYPIAVTANDLNVPVTVVGSSGKFIGGEFDFGTTSRPKSEVLLEPPQGFDIENPAYDSTPMRLLHSIVTEETILRF
jgi:translation initiation factor eIF-2B subunit delta